MNSTSFRDNPLNKIIGLSVVLSMGFLLVILAGIYGSWSPIVIGIIFAVAHLPVVITKAVTENSDYDFNFDPSSSLGSLLKEAGQFTLAFLVCSGFYVPVVLHHSNILTRTAMVLTIIGGFLIYSTVYAFSLFFVEGEPDEMADLGGGVL